MAAFVPLIRTAALVPWLVWLDRNNRPVQARLAEAGMGYVLRDEPNRAIPLLEAMHFARAQARHEGPDIGCRVVSDNSLADLATLGAVLLTARTPREGLTRMSAVLPRHCTHEVMAVEDRPGGLLFTEHWLSRLDPVALHVAQQYVAAMVLLMLRMTGHPGPHVLRLSIPPHPDHGLAHLDPWFGSCLVPAGRPRLEMLIPAAVADARLPPPPPELRGIHAPPDWTRLQLAEDPTATVRLAVETLLQGGVPTLDRVARAAGMSPRTFQRRLGAAGTSFTEVLDKARAARALALIRDGTEPIRDIASDLGYANPSALTRAVRRWTGQTPRALRP